MTWQSLRTRGLSLALAAAVTAGCALPAAAAEPISDGVRPTYDEAYYATLDYYGNLLEGSVVKSYALNGADSLTDYGVYDEVVNLTDSTAPAAGEGETTFRFGEAAPDHFYFEGKTARPFEDLPWTVSLGYTLNGVPAKAEDLAGQRGVVEISLDIVPNEYAGAYARYNYTLAATAIFNQDDILSLEAPGAQVQLVGNLRTVLFLCLPGEEQHFSIRVGSDDFSFSGLTVLMVPATLAQLEEIAKLSQRKDDLEEDYRALSGSLDNLLDALSDIQNGLYASAKGLDQLELARQTFSGGKGVLYDGTDRLRGDLSNLADLLEPVERRVQVLSQTVTESKAVLNELTDTAQDLRSQLGDLESALRGLESGTADVKNVIHRAAELEDSLLRLERALGGTHVSTPSIATNSKALVQQVKDVHSAYAEKDQQAFMEKMLVLNGEGSASAKAKAAGMAQLLAADAAGLLIPAGQEANLAMAKQLAGTHAAASSGKVSFQGFCENLPGVSESQAKQMNDLWIIYSGGSLKPDTGTSGSGGGTGGSGGETDSSGTGGSDDETSSGGTRDSGGERGSNETAGPGTQDGSAGQDGGARNAGAEEESAANKEEENKEEDSAEEAQASDTPEDAAPGDQAEMSIKEKNEKGTLSAKLLHNEDSGSSEDSSDESTGGSSDGGSDEGSGGSGDGGSDSGPAGGAGDGVSDSDSGDSGSDGDGASGGGPDGSGTGGGSSDESESVGGAVVDLITSGLDSATARIDAIQSELTSSLNAIKRPTAAVTGKLADLCGEMDNLIDVLDDAEDLSAALRQSAGTIQDILGDADELRTVLNGYEPTLQESLANAGALSTSAVTTIRDTETLLADAEELARSTGTSLDEGTRQSLTGLASALRQTAKALAATGDVRDAKNTITDIIEDVWHEYTGDVNNILLMDAGAEPVSLTDERNPAPTSIQVLIRTQEIKAEEPEEDEEAAAAKAATTFWGRISRMFQDFWNAVTGIFR